MCVFVFLKSRGLSILGLPCPCPFWHLGVLTSPHAFTTPALTGPSPPPLRFLPLKPPPGFIIPPLLPSPLDTPGYLTTLMGLSRSSNSTPKSFLVQILKKVSALVYTCKNLYTHIHTCTHIYFMHYLRARYTCTHIYVYNAKVVPDTCVFKKAHLCVCVHTCAFAHVHSYVYLYCRKSRHPGTGPIRGEAGQKHGYQLDQTGMGHPGSISSRKEVVQSRRRFHQCL